MIGAFHSKVLIGRPTLDAYNLPWKAWHQVYWKSTIRVASVRDNVEYLFSVQRILLELSQTCTRLHHRALRNSGNAYKHYSRIKMPSPLKTLRSYMYLRVILIFARVKRNTAKDRCRYQSISQTDVLSISEDFLARCLYRRQMMAIRKCVHGFLRMTQYNKKHEKVGWFRIGIIERCAIMSSDTFDRHAGLWNCSRIVKNLGENNALI